MIQKTKHFYEFGAYRVDPANRLLWRGGEIISLPPKSFDLLLALVEESGRVLTKDELMRRVWQDSFVEEANLSNHVFTLRKALGEDKNGAKYIETIPRRGYRFVAQVTEVEDAPPGVVVVERTRSHILIDEDLVSDPAGSNAQTVLVPTLIPPVVNQAKTTFKKPVWIVAVASAILIGLALAITLWMTSKAKPERNGLAVKSIAVLPLKVVGENPGDSDYLADGISEALITRLTRLSNLRVIPWVTAERYKQSTKPLQAIAQEMGVDGLITGSLRRAGDRIAVTVSLIDADSGLQYWADEFEEPLADIFTVQRRIALGAATQLRGRLNPQQEQALGQSASHSAEAYEYYLRGKAALKQGSSGSKERNQLAFDLFQKALSIDPNLAEAYVGIGRTQWNRAYLGWGEKNLEEAEASLQHALDLDPTMADAYSGLIRASWLGGKSEDGLKYGQKVASLGLEDVESLNARARAYYYGGLWDKAIPIYERVFEIDPANEDARDQLVPSLLFMGEYQKAVEAGEMLLRRFRETAWAHYWTGGAYHCLGDFERAKQHYEQAVKLSPDVMIIYLSFGSLYKQHGRLVEAKRIWEQGFDVIKKKIEANPDNKGLHGMNALFNGKLGNRDAVVKEEQFILREAPDNGSLFDMLAFAYAFVGDTERAVEFLRQALRLGYLNHYNKKILKLNDAESLEQSAAYQDFLNEWTQTMNRLREQY